MRVQSGLGRLALAILLFSLASCDRLAPVVDRGVSLELAQHRARTISEINYCLHFDIPKEVDADINGIAAISFELMDSVAELQLDFREADDKISSVMSNGESSDYRFENEHIVIPGSELIVGANENVIEFTAGSTSLNRNPEYLYTLFVPDRARTAFPLFDQPDLKATYDLTLNVPAGWNALSNASFASVEHDGNRTEYSFSESDLISSYFFCSLPARSISAIASAMSSLPYFNKILCSGPLTASCFRFGTASGLLSRSSSRIAQAVARRRRSNVLDSR